MKGNHRNCKAVPTSDLVCLEHQSGGAGAAGKASAEALTLDLGFLCPSEYTHTTFIATA